MESLQVPSVSGTSQVGDAVLGMMSQNGFGRPAHNKEKHCQELQDINLMYTQSQIRVYNKYNIAMLNV